MDLNQISALIGNIGVPAFLIIWYVLKGSKVVSDMSTSFKELTTAINKLIDKK